MEDHCDSMSLMKADKIHFRHHKLGNYIPLGSQEARQWDIDPTDT